MGYNHFVATILMKSVHVVAVYTVCMLTLLSCWPGMYWIWVWVELLENLWKICASKIKKQFFSSLIKFRSFRAQELQTASQSQLHLYHFIACYMFRLLWKAIIRQLKYT